VIARSVSGSAEPRTVLAPARFRWGGAHQRADLDPKLLERRRPRRAPFKTLLIDGKWSELLEQSENLMAMAPGRVG
jgi:hypothetical protein